MASLTSADVLHWFHYDDARSFSFNSWMPKKEANLLSESGFYYIGDMRKVTCVGCNQTFSVKDVNTLKSDHASKSPRCNLYRLSIVTSGGLTKLTAPLKKGIDRSVALLIDDDTLMKCVEARFNSYLFRYECPPFYKKLADNGFRAVATQEASVCTYCRFWASHHHVTADDIVADHAEKSSHCKFVTKRDQDDI